MLQICLTVLEHGLRPSDKDTPLGRSDVAGPAEDCAIQIVSAALNEPLRAFVRFSGRSSAQLDDRSVFQQRGNVGLFEQLRGLLVVQDTNDIFSGVRFHTVTDRPAARSVRAKAAPIAPIPITVISLISVPSI
jgi:hypothetical protein